MLKSYGVECAGGHVVMCRRPCGGGPCDFSVSPSPFGLDFGLGLDNLQIFDYLCLNCAVMFRFERCSMFYYVVAYVASYHQQHCVYRV